MLSSGIQALLEKDTITVVTTNMLLASQQIFIIPSFVCSKYHHSILKIIYFGHNNGHEHVLP